MSGLKLIGLLFLITGIAKEDYWPILKFIRINFKIYKSVIRLF